MDRRKFIRTGVAGIAALSVTNSGLSNIAGLTATDVTVDKVKLGNTGLMVSRIAMGTGSKGYNKASDQTRLGMDNFVNLARHGYERGIRFFDMADGYGSQPYVGEAIKTLPREEITLLTKTWTFDDGSGQQEPVPNILDRYRKEIGTDYIDILLMHCMTDPEWSKKRKHYMDGLTKAKADGIIKAVGVSCHSWGALVDAAHCPWVDVIMARINPFNSHMDGTLEDVNELLGEAQKNGKGVIGMKIFGEGKHVADHEREESIQFAVTKGNMNCMTLGLTSKEQMDDAIERVMNSVNQ